MDLHNFIPVLILATTLFLNSPVAAQSSRIRDFWDQFPDMWRGVAPTNGATQQADVSRRNRFEDWKNVQQGTNDFSGLTSSSSNVHESVQNLFSGSSSGGLDGLRTAMTSLGMLGNVQPQMGRGELSFSNLFPEFQMPLAPKDWWKGPNICVERKEEDLLANNSKPGNTTIDNSEDTIHDDGSSIHISSCSQSSDNEAYSCVTEIRKSNFHRRYSVKYQCCYGFSRDSDLGLGCTKAIPMTTLPMTLTNLKLSSLYQALSDTGLKSLLDGGNYTIFAPNNEAFEEFQRPNNEVVSGGTPTTDLRTALKSHIITGLVRSSDFLDEQLLTSIGNSTIRINLFTTPTQVVTADCARIVSINNLAKNGVVHIVDRVIQPVTKTLETLLRDDGRFGTLLQLLDDAGLSDTLRNSTGHVTVLAPTDQAFRLMDHGLRNRLNDDRNCLKRVLQTHILPNVICSAVVDRSAITTNLLNKVVRFDRDVDRFTVQNITVSGVDEMATNGMFYVLEGVIIPEEAKSLLQIASDSGLSSFLNLVRKADLTSDMDSLRNVTMFTPSNRAIDRLSDELRSDLSTSTKDLQDVLHYHIVQPSVLLSDFKDNLLMDTQLDSQTLRMNIYEAYPFGKNIVTVNCAKITVANLRGCDGTIHVLEKLLIPPTGDVLQVLEAKGNYSEFLTGLRKTGLDRAVRQMNPVTVFAPDDTAFAQLTVDEGNLLTGNASLLLTIMQLHVFPRQICCAGIMEDSLFFGQYTRSINTNYSLPLHKTRYGEIHIAGSGVSQCDIIARNGVVHFVDKVIFPKNFL